MPRSLSAPMISYIAEQSGFASIALLDVQTVDGTQYFWSDNNYNQFPNEFSGALTTYSPWLKQVGPITLQKSFQADAGDIVLQNLSGNSIDRDVSSAVLAHEFEGALAVLRLWLPLFGGTFFQFHGYLSEQQPGEEEAVFRMLQLSDWTEFNIAEDVVSELCTWRYKSVQCGSTGTATSCPKRLTDCQDPTRAAQERFNGVLLVPPASAIVNPPPVVTAPPVGAPNYPGGIPRGSFPTDGGRRAPLDPY